MLSFVEATMTSAASKVQEEMARFRAALPKLMESLSGRWVVFHNGNVVADFGGEPEAYEAAIEMLGPEAGFVVARVAPVEPRPISAQILFA
jgi:hypothetical protein